MHIKCAIYGTMSILNDSLRETLVSCLSQQLSEYELLKSMYPNQGEIILINNKILNDIENFIDFKTEYTPSHLDFVINLSLDALKLEICINLPSFYPQEEPDIYIRCNQLNRQEETAMNTQLKNYIKENCLGEVCLYAVILWLQENNELFKLSRDEDKSSEKSNEANVEENFTRLWIFSHHIYNKNKREEIVSRARDLNITGFCLPGKPGIICIEGPDSNCKEWWKTIKSMNWKKIIIRKTEIFNPSEQSVMQKFNKFEEIHFQNALSRHNKHADMSGFSKYMEEHGLTHVFNDFFGLCNDI